MLATQDKVEPEYEQQQQLMTKMKEMIDLTLGSDEEDDDDCVIIEDGRDEEVK